jgi:vacuolar-type H+-ATPase subunit F/Vma7
MPLAVVGRPEVIAPFRAAGLAVFESEAGPGAAARVEELIESGYAVIFYTEDLGPHLAGQLARHSSEALPCLAPLPTVASLPGVGAQGRDRLREMVKRAVGADVLRGERR